MGVVRLTSDIMTLLQVLLALIVPVFISAQDINPTCALGDDTLINDSRPIDCLVQTADTYMKKNFRTAGCTNATTRDYLKKCLNATMCVKTLKSMKSEKIQQNLNMSMEILYEIMDFAFADNKYQAFVSSNGTKCINKIRPEMQKCVVKAIYGNVRNSSKRHNSTGDSSRLNSTTPHHDSPRNSSNNVTCDGMLIVNLEKSGGCHESKALKTCVEKAMNNETVCKPEHNNFVSSFFDFVADKYCFKNKTNIVNTNSSNSIYSTTHVIFLFILVLSTLPIFM